MIKDVRIAVLGGGVAGLHAAYLLAKAGVTPLLIEKEDSLGGLCSDHDRTTYRIERYYHHIFPTDTSLLELLDEMGLADDVMWRSGKTGFYFEGTFYDLNTPLDLLRFGPLNLIERIRLGVQTLRMRGELDWEHLDGVDAEHWLIATYGESIYRKMFRPLLLTKFGLSMDKASAAFVGGRLQARVGARGPGMVKERLGYIHGGFHRLIEAWKRGIEERGGHIATGADVRSLERSDTGFSIRVNIDGTEEVIRSDAVLNTLPIPLLLQLLSNPPSETRARLSRISYRAVLCLTIGLKRRLMPYYWLNILDEGLPFGGIIEHTNLVPENDYTGEHIVYIFRYLDTSDPWWTMDEARIRHEVLTGLERIFPDLSEEDVIWSALARDEYATPQFLTEYGDHMPRPRTDIEGLFMAGSFQVYPFSRNINNTIQASATAVDDVKAYLRWDGAGQG